MEIECAVKNSVTDKRVDGIDEDNWCEVFMNWQERERWQKQI